MLYEQTLGRLPSASLHLSGRAHGPLVSEIAFVGLGLQKAGRSCWAQFWSPPKVCQPVTHLLWTP